MDDLLHTDPKYFVVRCEADSYVDLNDVEDTDVLLAVVQQLWEDTAKERIRLHPGKLRSSLEELWNILTAPVTAKEFKINAAIAEIGFEIQKNPDARQQVRAYLRPRATTFLEALNEVVQRAEAGFKNKGYAGPVVIVDNLDRVFRNFNAETRRTTHDTIFVDASDRLRVACHMIYTLPPALLYSSNGPKLPALYGTQPRVMPMIPTTTRTDNPNDPGLQKLVEAVEKRLHYAGVKLDQAFDHPQILHQLCTNSGGYVRSLMTLMQTALNYVADLPITADAVRSAINDNRDTYQRSVRTDPQWQLLREVARAKRIGDSEECMQLLDNLAVLEYRDADGPWHDVNPAVKEAPDFRSVGPQR
jgi:hypothetical protein